MVKLNVPQTLPVIFLPRNWLCCWDFYFSANTHPHPIVTMSLLTLPLNTLDPTFPAWMWVIASQLVSQFLTALQTFLQCILHRLGMPHTSYLLVLLLLDSALGILSFRKLSLSPISGLGEHPGLFLTAPVSLAYHRASEAFYLHLPS